MTIRTISILLRLSRTITGGGRRRRSIIVLLRLLPPPLRLDIYNNMVLQLISITIIISRKEEDWRFILAEEALDRQSWGWTKKNKQTIKLKADTTSNPRQQHLLCGSQKYVVQYVQV